MFRIFLIERYSVIDGTFYDVATSQNTTKWNNYGANASYSDNGTTLSTGTDYRYQPYVNLDEDMAVEFDLYIPSTPQINPNLYVRGLSPYFSAEWFPRDVWHHIKVTCSNGNYDLYSDGERKVGGAYNISNRIFQFRTSDNSTLTFKNFVVYPI